MTPQILLSGFLVAYDALPSYVSWLLWLQPLTYTFRLLLYEELSPCSVLSEFDEHTLNCLDAFQNGQHRLDAIYGPDSVLTLMAAGEYIGTDAISEYLAYFSPAQDRFSFLWDFCGTEGSQIVQVNQVGEGFCDVSFADITQARVNENLSLEPDTWMELVFGRHVQIRYPEDKSTFTVTTEDIFLPPAAVATGYDEITTSAALSAVACNVLESSCPQEFAANNFSDPIECIEKMTTELPLTTQNSVGRGTVDGNSTGCRHLHASLAALDPERHCPHVSFYPIEDPGGKLKCSGTGDDFLLEDFFTPKDFSLFRRTAEAGGLSSNDTETGFFRLMDKSERKPCFSGFIEPRAVQHQLPSNFACYTYLTQTQGVSSDGIIPYGWALVGFWLATRILWVVLLRYRALLQ